MRGNYFTRDGPSGGFTSNRHEAIRELVTMMHDQQQGMYGG